MNNVEYTNYKNQCMGVQGLSTGNSIDIDLNQCEQLGEVKADIVLNTDINNECNVVRLWGQIKDCNGCSVPNALLKLLKIEKYKGRCEYKGVAHTISDCEGFYQFDLCYCDGSENYKILVSRTSTGTDELVLPTEEGNCNVYGSNGPNVYQPCEQGNQICKQGSSINCNTQQNNDCEDVSQCQSSVYPKNYKKM
ncbi:hypothetical protein QOZ83_16310 [Romboutsia sedimentorum]|uniref:hypothetical protein n=1 Tax=Romboutsia sedimentorum TaxID=1368474 RepID=UPI0024DED098|nr:hypothetical protein [Romboutsia sedimentorum]MDK2587408.1 hypothetical protein [Romboutsia sedimentorum]